MEAELQCASLNMLGWVSFPIFDSHAGFAPARDWHGATLLHVALLSF